RGRSSIMDSLLISISPAPCRTSMRLSSIRLIAEWLDITGSTNQLYRLVPASLQKRHNLRQKQLWDLFRNVMTSRQRLAFYARRHLTPLFQRIEAPFDDTLGAPEHQ